MMDVWMGFDVPIVLEPHRQLASLLMEIDPIADHIRMCRTPQTDEKIAGALR
jgi:hypothetical protein